MFLIFFYLLFYRNLNDYNSNSKFADPIIILLLFNFFDPAYNISANLKSSRLSISIDLPLVIQNQ